MQAIEKKNIYTAEDFELLEEGAPFQLINFDLVMSPSPLLIHQDILFQLSEIIVLYHIKERKGKWVYAPMDVKFDEGNVLQPDILYIAEERINEVAKDRVEGAPDLVIEILSPSNAYYDLRQKKDVYEKYGVKEYMIIDTVALNADLYALKDGIYYLHQRAQKNESLKSVILPGFILDMNNVFRNL